jgi:predicted Rdx family selenoprotein
VRDALQARGITDVDLQPGCSGQLDITINGERQYSRHLTGRFPSAEDIAKLTE